MTANNDPLGYFKLLDLDPYGLVSDQDVTRRYKAEARQCYPGGGGKQPDPKRFALLSEARKALATEQAREYYKKGLKVTGEPLASRMTYVKRERGDLAKERDPLTLWLLILRARDRWFDGRVRAGKTPLPMERVLSTQIGVYVVASLAVAGLGLGIFVLVRFWADIFDVIHFVEAVIRVIIIIVDVVIKIIEAIVRAIAAVVRAIKAASAK